MLCLLSAKGQQRPCSCATVSAEEFSMDCRTRALRGGGQLYYQFNCDSIWLTLQSRSGKRHLLYSVPTQLRRTHERVGYVLEKEFRDVLLFQTDCVPPTGCSFLLIDKASGRTRAQLGEPLNRVRSGPLDEYLLYLEKVPTALHLVLYAPDRGNRIRLPLRLADFTDSEPDYTWENRFTTIALKGHILRVTYTLGGGTTRTKTVRFDLRRYGKGR